MAAFLLSAFALLPDPPPLMIVPQKIQVGALVRTNACKCLAIVLLRYETAFPTGGCDAHVELDRSNKEQLLPGREERGEIGAEEGNEVGPSGTRQPPTVLRLCFNEEQSFSEAPLGEGRSVAAVEVSMATELSWRDGGGGSSCSGEGIELSEDGELRLWRYPRDGQESVADGEQEDVFVKEEEEEREFESSRVDKVEPGCVAEHVPDGGCQSRDGPVEMQEDGNCRPEESQSSSDEPVRRPSNSGGDKASRGGLHGGAGTEDVDVCIIKLSQKDVGGCVERADRQSNEIQSVRIEGDDTDVESGRSSSGGGERETEGSPPAETPTGCTELQIDVERGAEVEAASSNADGSSTRVAGSHHLSQGEQTERDALGGRRGGADGPGPLKAEGAGRPKKVAFAPEANASTGSGAGGGGTNGETGPGTTRSSWVTRGGGGELGRLETQWTRRVSRRPNMLFPPSHVHGCYLENWVSPRIIQLGYVGSWCFTGEGTK